MSKLNDKDLLVIEQKYEKDKDGQYFQVDVLKALMIFLVIFDHIVGWSVKSYIGVTLWERISIPIFLIVMGFNMGLSFQRKNDLTLRELYSWHYFKSKIIRYIVPFLILYAASTFIGLFMYGFDISAMYHGQYYPQHGFIQLFFGILPFWGPGNWFIPLLFQSILIMPLLYRAFKKKPILTLIICFAAEITMQLTVFYFIGEITSWQEVHYINIFMNSILFYLSAVGLGIWFSFGYKLEDNRNFFMWFLYPISLAFIVVYQFFSYRIMVGDVPLLRGDYHFLIFPYSAFLFLLAMKLIPQTSEGPLSRSIKLISKSTYHILLTQILGYGMIFAFWGTHYAIDVLVTIPLDRYETIELLEALLNLISAWILFISFGILWYKIDQNKNLYRRILYYLNFFIVFASILFLMFWVQEAWVPITLVIIIVYAVIALITTYIIKKPLKTKILSLWTLFLLMTFVMMILQVQVFQSNESWIPLIIVAAFLLIAVVGTILDYRS